MPGVYFSAETSALKHLAAKLTSAVVTAVNMAPGQKAQLVAAALAARFSTTEMMERWASVWHACGVFPTFHTIPEFPVHVFWRMAGRPVLVLLVGLAQLVFRSRLQAAHAIWPPRLRPVFHTPFSCILHGVLDRSSHPSSGCG